jgi:hypothetical protein
MRKKRELKDPNSCLNKARKNERLFVLLERDKAFIETVRFWANKRLELGLNLPTDDQIKSALKLALKVEKAQAKKAEKESA